MAKVGFHLRGLAPEQITDNRSIEIVLCKAKANDSPYLARKVLCSFNIRCSSAVKATTALFVVGRAVGLVVVAALVAEAVVGRAVAELRAS